MTEEASPDSSHERPRVKAAAGSVRTPVLLLVALVVLIVVSAGFVVVAVRHHNAAQAPVSLRATGVPASISTRIADLMALSPVPNHEAPSFTLTDQNGHAISLSSMRGKAVVLEFMDPHCVDICPIVSQEFVDAYHDLGAQASKVIFVAINVNKYFASVTDMKTFTNEHRLNTIPSWHFLTGPVAGLPAIWHAYGIDVIAPTPTSDIIHTSVMYFIDPKGHERFLANPMVDHTSKGSAYLPATSLTAWGHGIALTLKDLIK